MVKVDIIVRDRSGEVGRTEVLLPGVPRKGEMVFVDLPGRRYTDQVGVESVSWDATNGIVRVYCR
jgi:hypothetical protein